MKKYTSMDEAIAQYTAHTGLIPEVTAMIALYHLYRNEWKAFDGFLDWLIYNE